MGLETPKLATLTAVLLSIAAAAVVVVVGVAHSPGAVAGTAPLVPVVWVAWLAALQLGFRQREANEAAESESQRADASRLFEEAAIFLDAQRAREHFEKFAVPVFVILLAAVEAGLGHWLFRRAPTAGATGDRALFCVAMLALVAVVAYIGGRVLGALATDRAEPLLRPAAAGLLAVTGSAALGAAGLWLSQSGRPQAEVWTQQLVAVGFAVVALDHLLSLALEVYRARGGQAQAVYDSRVVQLLTQPGRGFDTLAGMLDYQFGWRVSRTTVYRAVAAALAPWVLFQLVTLWLLSCLVCLGPGEVGVRERLGRIVPGELQPGAHLIAPWPLERVVRVPVGRLQTIEVGLGQPHDETAVISWTTAHGHAAHPLLLAAREGIKSAELAEVRLAVDYQITAAAQYLSASAEPLRLLSKLAWRETTAALLAAPADAPWSAARQALADEIRANLAQQSAGLGLQVVAARLEGGHPPAKVAVAYEQAVAAREAALGAVAAARAEAAAALPKAAGDAAKRVADAEGGAYRRRTVAQAEAKRFSGELQALQAAPEVYRVRRRLETMRGLLAGRPKTIVAADNAREVTTVDLTPKLRPDLLEMPVPGAEGDGHE